MLRMNGVPDGKKRYHCSVFFHILGLAAGAHRPFADSFEPFTAFFTAIVLSLQPLRRNIDIDRPTNGTHPDIHLTRCIIRQDDNPIEQGLIRAIKHPALFREFSRGVAIQQRYSLNRLMLVCVSG